MTDEMLQLRNRGFVHIAAGLLWTVASSSVVFAFWGFSPGIALMSIFAGLGFLFVGSGGASVMIASADAPPSRLLVIGVLSLACGFAAAGLTSHVLVRYLGIVEPGSFFANAMGFVTFAMVGFGFGYLSVYFPYLFRGSRADG